MSTVLRAAMTAVFFLCSGPLVGLGLAEARQRCVPLAVFERAISDQYQEERVAVATANGSKDEPFAMIWYENRETGTWTQLVVSQAGMACHMASGQGGIRRVDAADSKSGGPARPPHGLRGPVTPHGGNGSKSSAPRSVLPPLTEEQKRLIRRALEARDA
jgi:hypothetical protein